MTTLEIFLIIILIIAVAVFVLYIFYNSKKTSNSSLDLLQREMQSMKESFDKRMLENTEKMTKESREQADKLNQETKQQYQTAAKLIQSVTSELTQVKMKNDEILSFTSQLNNLEKVLSSQKQRGAFGEYLLDSVLSDIFPYNLYETQYTFKDGKTVDAVLKLKDKIIPIDSKFSLENYRKYLEEDNKAEKEKYFRQLKTDLKERINETASYIKPEYGTVEFAFMFIPSEAIYYTLMSENIGDENLLHYATSKKKVIIVSPTTIVAYLQTVLQGLKGMQIEQKAQEILKALSTINKKTMKSAENFERLGKSLQATVNHFNTTSKSFELQNKEIVKVIDSKEQVSIKEIDKPNI